MQKPGPIRGRMQKLLTFEISRELCYNFFDSMTYWVQRAAAIKGGL
jgi:hypothetical protein